ncbi:MAG: class I SAM-dependent methyltransferase [Burkholderiales bacterium]
MNSSSRDATFAGSVPHLYEKYLVPLIFEPYAVDIAGRVAARRPGRVLELAAGTGVVTRRLVDVLPSTTRIVATDLNQPMLDEAVAVGTARAVEWQRADAMQLPFADGTFDAIVCQFGVMFFPGKAAAFAEARRVLAPGGAFLFNVWDGLDQNEFADTVTRSLEPMFPADPPRFMARTPHGYHDQATIRQDLVAGGFDRPPEFTTVAARSRAASAQIAAVAYCQGTLFRGEIEARDAARLSEATDAAAAALAARFGPDPIDGKIQAQVIVVER